MPANNTIPEAYQGREQALIKHGLLEAYLKKLFLIVGMGVGRVAWPSSDLLGLVYFLPAADALNCAM